MTDDNENFTEVIRSEDVVEFSLHRRVIYGLNIFHVNDVIVDFKDEPLTVFLKTLAEKLFCSVHMGNLSNFATPPEELFGVWMNNHLLSQTTIFESYFYDFSQSFIYQSVFFPAIDESFWTEKLADNDSSLTEILGWRAVAVYLNEEVPNLNEIKELVQGNSPSHENWIKQITELYKLTLLPDNNYVYVYAREERNLELLNEALEAAMRVIEQNQWFRENKNNLVWDDNLVNCLTLKT